MTERRQLALLTLAIVATTVLVAIFMPERWRLAAVLGTAAFFWLGWMWFGKDPDN
jgi:uncharacterized membrane protein YqjE